MDGLLTAVKTVTRDSRPTAEPTTDINHGLERRDTGQKETVRDPTSATCILDALRSKPEREQLSQVLSILDPSNKNSAPTEFDIRIPSPISAHVLQTLVNVTIPDVWAQFNSKSDVKSGGLRLRGALLRCFCSVAGVSSLVAQLRSLIMTSRSSAEHAKGSGSDLRIRDVLEVLAALLEPNDFLFRVYMDISIIYPNETQKQLTWREFTALIAASRVLSTAAEALALIRGATGLTKVSWIGDGPKYASWIGDNICQLASKMELIDENVSKSVAWFTGRALSLGYIGHLVSGIYSGLLVNQSFPEHFGALVNHLRVTEQVAVMEAIFRDVEKKYFSDDMFLEADPASNKTISGVATLCSNVITNRPHLQAQVADWLSKGQGGSIQTVGLRKALLINFADKTESLRSLFTKSLEQFGDNFYIKHAPTRCQEANTQAVLLAAGYLQQADPTIVREIGRSGIFLNAISNRIAASSIRARFLGMVVGTAISELIEPPGKTMKFDLEEMEGDEARWYLNLTKTKDTLGPLDSLHSRTDSILKAQKPHSSPKPTHSQANQQSSKVVPIEEIDERENENEEDEDLIPYEKPDDDFSDDDDDPTLVQRNKPIAPVYIRDLVTYLRDNENVERYHLAITSSPSLIRRKTGFGTELTENLEELALTLVGLQDSGNLPKFHEYRLQSMIAVIVALPLKMGRWFSAMYFDGDISQIQRSAILTALGLGARELAGNGEEDARVLGLPIMPEDASFPSKRLSATLEALYGSKTEGSPIASLTRQLSQTSLQPLAANAADAVSGPNALKVRTFSSRMEVEKRRQQREAQRQRSRVKDVHKVLLEGFFYPLKGRFDTMMMQFSSSTAPTYNPFSTPHLLALFLQTLTLILSTMGPHTPSLPVVTQETLSLLLSLYTRPVSDDPTILSALLSLFLAVVDLNVTSGTSGEERLVTDFATQVMELREWAGEVFDHTSSTKGDDSSDDPQGQTRTLAAGIMVKLGEVMERYQGRLMGVGVGFRY